MYIDSSWSSIGCFGNNGFYLEGFQKLHRRTMLKIPMPHFVTFYDGTSADSQSRKVPSILNKCHTLRDYMTFVNKVNEKKYLKNKDIRTAVTEAVDECIASGILSDFFSEHREEVIDVSVYDYDEEGRMRVEREEGWLDGHGKGREEGHQEELISQIIPKVQKGKDINTIASEVEKDVDNIKPLYDVVVAAAPDYDMDKIMMGISHSSKI